MNATLSGLRRVMNGALGVVAFFGGAVVVVTGSDLTPYVTSGTAPLVRVTAELGVATAGICIMGLGLIFVHIAIEDPGSGETA